MLKSSQQGFVSVNPDIKLECFWKKIPQIVLKHTEKSHANGRDFFFSSLPVEMNMRKNHSSLLNGVKRDAQSFLLSIDEH